MKEQSPPSAEEWLSWVLVAGVVTVSLLGPFLRAWQLVRQGWLFCPGILGTMGGCLGLLIWQLWRARSTNRPDWVSLIALGVIVVPYGVLTLWIMLISAALAGDPNSVGPDVLDDAWVPRVTTAVASLGYVVLVVRRLERALRWRTKGAAWSSAALIIIVIAAIMIAAGLVLSRPQSMPVPVVTTVPSAVPRGQGESDIIEPVPAITIVPIATPTAPE